MKLELEFRLSGRFRWLCSTVSPCEHAFRYPLHRKKLPIHREICQPNGRGVVRGGRRVCGRTESLQAVELPVMGIMYFIGVVEGLPR